MSETTEPTFADISVNSIKSFVNNFISCAMKEGMSKEEAKAFIVEAVTQLVK